MWKQDASRALRQLAQDVNAIQNVELLSRMLRGRGWEPSTGCKYAPLFDSAIRKGPSREEAIVASLEATGVPYDFGYGVQVMLRIATLQSKQFVNLSTGEYYRLLCYIETLMAMTEKRRARNPKHRVCDLDTMVSEMYLDESFKIWTEKLEYVRSAYVEAGLDSMFQYSNVPEEENICKVNCARAFEEYAENLRRQFKAIS